LQSGRVSFYHICSAIESQLHPLLPRLPNSASGGISEQHGWQGCCKPSWPQMPLHDPHTTAASPTDEGLPPILAPDLPEPGQLTQLSGVVDILRLARAARQVSEELVHPLQGARPGSPRYGPPAHPSVASVSRSTTSASNAMARPYTSSSPRPGRRQDSSRYRHPHDSALPRYYSPPSRAESTSQLAAPRQEEVGPSNSGMLSANSNLSRTHLDSEDFSSRLSMLRANALLMRDDLERAMEELALPLYGPRSDIIPPRNHHRHSSMSMSPRVLETTHPNDASSHRRARNVEDKLEDVLFFLDTQRLRHPASPNQASCPLYFDKSLVSECSWLRLASKFQGFQTFKRPSVPTMSNISRQLHALQAFQTRDWKVDVVIDYIDYSNMSIAGSMTMLQSNEQQRVKIFWTGEVSSFSLDFRLSAYHNSS